MIRRIATILVVGIAATALVACEGEVSASIGKKLDTKKLEGTIEKELVRQTEGDAAFTVGCPDDVELKKDDEFDCTFEQEDGDEGKVTVTQTDGKGNVDYAVTEVNGQTEDEMAAANEEEAVDPETGEPMVEEEVVEGE